MTILLSVLFSLRRTELAFKLAFPICVVINLLPQLLLEFRYFVIPFILQRLQLRPQSWWTLMAEMALFQFVNIGKGNRNCFFSCQQISLCLILKILPSAFVTI